MKYSFAAAALFLAAVLVDAAQSKPGTYIPHEKVAEALAKGGVLTGTTEFVVQGGHRTTPSQVEVHEKETDIIYVTDGEVTYVTGGTMVGGKVTAPNQLRGTSIEGGESHRLTKGDVIVVPAGTPHWSKDVPESVSFYIVKVLKP